MKGSAMRKLMFGAILAAVLSWVVNQSGWWFVLHALLNWLYVFYWVLAKTQVYAWLQSVSH